MYMCTTDNKYQIFYFSHEKNKLLLNAGKKESYKSLRLFLCLIVAVSIISQSVIDKQLCQLIDQTNRSYSELSDLDFCPLVGHTWRSKPVPPARMNVLVVDVIETHDCMRLTAGTMQTRCNRLLESFLFALSSYSLTFHACVSCNLCFYRTTRIRFAWLIVFKKLLYLWQRAWCYVVLQKKTCFEKYSSLTQTVHIAMSFVQINTHDLFAYKKIIIGPVWYISFIKINHMK